MDFDAKKEINKIRKFNKCINQINQSRDDLIELIRLDERNRTLSDYDINDYEINRAFDEEFEDSFNDIKGRWDLLNDYHFVSIEEIYSTIVNNQTIYYYVYNFLRDTYSRKLLELNDSDLYTYFFKRIS